MSHHTGIKLAEVGFLLMLFAGVWFVVAGLPRFRGRRSRNVVAGAALAVGSLLLIVATHFGHYG